METKVIYVPLEPLALSLGLPKRFLRELVDDNAIPSLNVNGRLRFNPIKVQEALDEIAACENKAKSN